MLDIMYWVAMVAGIVVLLGMVAEGLWVVYQAIRDRYNRRLEQEAYIRMLQKQVAELSKNKK